MKYLKLYEEYQLSINEQVIIDDILNEGLKDIKDKVLSYLKKGVLTGSILIALLGSVKGSEKNEILQLVKQENPELYTEVLDSTSGDPIIKEIDEFENYISYRTESYDITIDKQIKNGNSYYTVLLDAKEGIERDVNLIILFQNGQKIIKKVDLDPRYSSVSFVPSENDKKLLKTNIIKGYKVYTLIRFIDEERAKIIKQNFINITKNQKEIDKIIQNQLKQEQLKQSEREQSILNYSNSIFRDQEIKEEVPQREIFTVVEEQPQFPNGEEQRLEWLKSNLKYPEEAKELGIQGKVFVTFVVEKDGSITNVRTLRGIGGGCDEEAVRLVQQMPKWLPGKNRGSAVRVQFNLPIKFSLN